MKIDKWIEQVGPKVVARKLNVDVSTVSTWRSGTAFPRPEKLLAIYKLSRGRVTYDRMIHHFLSAQK